MLLVAGVVLVAGCTRLAARGDDTSLTPTGSTPPSGQVLPATATPDADGSASSGPTGSPGHGSRVLQVSGSSNRRTGSFVVDDSWSITWDHVGRHLFSVQLVPAASKGFGDLVVSTTARTKGSERMYHAGRFVVQVYASDRWSVTVSDEPDARVAGLPLTVSGAGPSNTAPFRADEPWVVEWTLPNAASFGLELYPLTEAEPWLLASSERASSGCAEVGVTGDLYLHVVTDGRWTLRLAALEGEVVCPSP